MHIMFYIYIYIYIHIYIYIYIYIYIKGQVEQGVKISKKRKFKEISKEF